MIRCFVGALVGSLPSAAGADVMHWFWEVEVNGRAVDPTSPIGVRPGDRVNIGLWADFDPYGVGFAGAHFAIRTGDLFFLIGSVNTSPLDGYGLNDKLDGVGEPGSFADSDGDGGPDSIDGILPFQLPHWFNAEYDFSDPLCIYRLGWDVLGGVESEIKLSHSPTLAGESVNRVYLDPFGRFADYAPVSGDLVFVPGASSVAIFIATSLFVQRRQRAE